MLDKVEKGLSVMYWVRQGCIVLASNLLFAGFFLWGVYAAFVAYRLETNGGTAAGVVVAMDKSTSDGSTTFSPIIEFQLDGQTYTFDGGISSNPPQYKIGDQVNVRYDKADPSRAQIDKWSERWLMPAILIPAICITAIIVNVVFFFAWKRNQI